jgi:uncharacterized membrane protein
MTFNKPIFSVAAFALTIVPLSFAQGTYTQIDVPNSISTAVYGINSAGDLVGDYQDLQEITHGFLLSGGVYTTIDYPGVDAIGTVARGINDSGKIVGYSAAADIPTYRGFEYDIATKSFTPINYSENSWVSTFPLVINNAGLVGGVAEDRSFQEVGFEWDGQFRTIVSPDRAPTTVDGLNNVGEFAVTVLDNPAASYLFSNGEFQLLTIPLPGALAGGLNDNGELVGTYFDKAEHVNLGFAYQNGSIVQILQFDGAYSTSPGNVNNSGVVAGTVFEFNGAVHGFTWTPPAPTHKESKQ